MPKDKFLKVALVFQDGWAEKSNICFVHVYSSNDKENWKLLDSFYTIAGQSSHLHIINQMIYSHLYRYFKNKDYEPETVVIESANIGVYLSISRFIKTIGSRRVKGIYNVAKQFSRINKNGNSVEVQLGDLTHKSYPVLTTYNRFKVAPTHFEHTGIPTAEFCLQESQLRKEIGAWEYGN
jgi:hypothetical protein